jgi:hypothetical protein
MRVPTLAPPPLPPGHTRAATVLRDLRATDAPLSPTAIRDAHDRGSWLPASVGLARVPLVPLPDTAPLTQTDWSKKLAWVLAYADSAIAVCVRTAKAELGADRNAAGTLFAPLFADLADLYAEIDDARGALCGHVNAERVLLAELAALAPLATQVQKAGAER